MRQIRIHGRGGQGVVTAAELIAIAAFHDGKVSQPFLLSAWKEPAPRLNPTPALTIDS